MSKKTYQRNTARRLLDSVSGSLARLGLSSRVGVIETTGRTSGEPRSTPVDLIRADGQLYVVGIYGAKSWVLNLRADPACRVRSREGEMACSATELPAAEGAPILRQYLAESSFVRDYQEVGPDDSDEAMLAAAADRPVFRLAAA
jgi:deazaflavin-dependent oxidoreductase (nitroreductase family)